MWVNTLKMFDMSFSKEVCFVILSISGCLLSAAAYLEGGISSFLIVTGLLLIIAMRYFITPTQ